MAKSAKAAAADVAPAGADDPELLLHLYRQMLLIRRFEEKAGQLYGMGLIAGFCHLYIGQEAVVVGLHAAATEADSVITTYRDHGHMLVCGMEPRGVMAELTGRIGGYSKGKGGSMHMFSRDKKFYGGHGIVGASVPLGTGLAFAHKYREDGGINFCYFGDGAANQGQVYEAFNMASLWKLPIIYVIENNRYGMGTSVARASATTELYRRGDAFGIPGVPVNGMSVLDVLAAARPVVAHVRGGEGPYVMEMNTYRYRGHSMSDPAKYRPKEEVSQVRKESDPIDTLRTDMLARGIADEAAFKEIDREIKDIVNDAADFAQTSPEPDPSELWTDILLEA
ncbi:MAG: pyruvate dehydrogenase (acetyl-transferring) E1 component subunit alpha [Rhodospirillales bacterium]|nr:pyruvate dehydrogenase (acetyl-transferring) E1 component subunit alpha [Rhodospirillales bacterium]